MLPPGPAEQTPDPGQQIQKPSTRITYGCTGYALSGWN
jgi:hypothetical protein